MPFLRRLCCLCQVKSKGSVRHTARVTDWKRVRDEERERKAGRKRERENVEIRVQANVCCKVLKKTKKKWKTEENQNAQKVARGKDCFRFLGKITAMEIKEKKKKSGGYKKGARILFLMLERAN